MSSGQSKTVVSIGIVDDKLIVRNAIREKLRSYQDIKIVMEAINGEVFLDQMKTANIDKPEIVLMDIEMPVLDGIRTIGIASTLYPQMKFIVLTVFDHNEAIFEAIRAGASGYLIKDDPAVCLAEAIRQVRDFDAVPMSPAIARKTMGLLKHGIEPQPQKTDLDVLSKREQDVLQYLVEGLDYRQIAEKLFISPATVRTHIAKIYQKLHVNSKAQAIRIAYKNRS